MNYLNPKILETEIKADGILYFLDGGHFLLRYQEKNAWKSKFVTIEDVANSLAGTESDTGWLGDGIIRAGRSERGEWFVYAAPAQRRDLILTTTDGTEKAIISVPLPATVLIGVGSAYYMFAGSQYAPMSGSSRLFRAPFPNIYTNGRICWGDNARPAAHHSKAKQVWELFFSTPFNSHLSNGKSKKCAKDVNNLLRELASAKKYPLDDLIDEDSKLEWQLGKVLDRDWSD